MAVVLGDVIGKIGGGGVILDRDVEFTVENAWVNVAMFEITSTCHIAATITHATVTDVTGGDSWSSLAPTVLIMPADGRSLVRGVNTARADCSLGPSNITVPLNTAGQLEPGKYGVLAHSQKSGRNVKLNHITVTAVPI